MFDSIFIILLTVYNIIPFVVTDILFSKYLFIMSRTEIILFDIQEPNLVSLTKCSGAEKKIFSYFGLCSRSREIMPKIVEDVKQM